MSRIATTPAARALTFAAPLEGSRWANILGDPAKALAIASKGRNATPSEVYFRNAVIKNHAGFVGTYLAALGLNQAILKASGSGDEINFFHPSRKDWLKFKGAGRMVDLSGGIITSIGFLGRLIAAGAQQKPDVREMANTVQEYGRGKLSPLAGLGVDVALRHDAINRPLPFSSDKGTAQKPRYGYPEYITTELGPIPLSGALSDFYKEMRNQGVPTNTIQQIFQAAASHQKQAAVAAGLGTLSGTTGIHIGSEYKPRPRRTR